MDGMDLKQVALAPVHRDLGAKMVPFAGFEMPLRYTSVVDEHLTVREKTGIFDVSHMGEFLITGAGALDLIQKITCNDASKLSIGQAQYSCLTNPDGGIIDDLLIYRLDVDRYMTVVNASNIEKDWDWINLQNSSGAALSNISDDMCLLAVQGPLAAEAIQDLTDIDLSAQKYYTFSVGTFAGIPEVIISATGYTGAGGFELYLSAKHATKAWENIMKSGRGYGIMAIGLGARDTLRLEKGYCLYGNDIDDQTTPLEAGLGWITRFTKEFIGSTTLREQKENGVSRKLVGFVMVERGIPRKDYPILDQQGSKIGMVTSGSQSPCLGVGIGLGYVSTEFSSLDQEIFIEIRNKPIKAIIKKLPLV
jgi:aminomethyltransferase